MKNKAKKVIIILSCVFFVLAISYLTLLTIYYHKYLYDALFYYVLILLSCFFMLGILSIIFIILLIYNKKHKAIKVRRILVSYTITSFIILTIFGSARYVMRKDYNTLYAFTREKWVESPVNDRWHLLPSLMKDHSIIGKSVDDVLYLLGEPDDTYESNYMYYIGYGRGLINIDLLYYNITFDEMFIVTSARIYQS